MLPQNRKKYQPKPQRPGVVLLPASHRRLLRGINQMVDAIRPTLGPLPRTVAVEKMLRDSMPEVIDSGGTIARRVIQLKQRDEDMGAMYLRHVLYEMYERAGDGTATAAVIFQSIFSQGLRYIAAGGNAMRLRGFLEEAGQVVTAQLEQMKLFREGKHDLANLALTICHDPELAQMMGEIFDIIGEFGRLEIRKGRSRELERDYVEGMYWDSGLYSRELMNDLPNVRAYMEDVPVLVSDLVFKEPGDLAPLLDFALANRMQKLVFMASEVSDRALAILLSKSNREKVEVMCVKMPGMIQDERLAALEDIAILTGGLPLHREAGDSLRQLTLENFGQARRAWANLYSLVLAGGKGDVRHLRQHIHRLRTAYANAKDPDVQKRLMQRIGKLLGGSATLWVGANTPLAMEARKELAEHTAEAMRGAMREGVVPGGGVALLNCRPALQARLRSLKQPEDARRAAYRILGRALEEPARCLLDNAGLDSHEVLAEMRRAGPGQGYDILAGKMVDLAQAGVCDSAAVVRQAVLSAVHGAALALTTDVLVHRRNPPEITGTTG